MRLAALLPLAVVLLAGYAPQGSERLQAIREAWLYVGEAEAPPPLGPVAGRAARGFEAVSLPDDWRQERRLRATEGWYALELELPAAPGPLQGVYLPRASLNAQVYVNGVLLGQGGRFEPPIARNHFLPIYVPLPGSLLQEGSNRIDVRLRTSLGSFGGLDPVWIGPDEVLRPIHGRARFLALNVTQLAHAISVLVATLSLVRIVRGGEVRPGMAWISVGMLCFSLGSFSILFPENPIPGRFLEWVSWTLLSLAVGLGAVGLRGAAARSSRQHTAIAVGIPSALGLGLALVPYERFLPLLALGIPLVFLLSLDGGWNALRAVRNGSLWPRAPMMILAFAIFGLPVVDWWIGPTDDLRLRPSVLNTGVAAVCLTWFLLANTLRAVFEAQRLDAELATQRAEAALERDRAITQERDRMVRDMHDGTAGHLVSALSLVRSGEAAPEQLSLVLQEALDDLRTTLEALDPAETTLAGVLGVMRDPIERRLRPHDIVLDWRIGDIDHVTDLDAADAGNLLRWIQEAVGNAIRHAKARRVEVRAGSGPGGGYWLCVGDDGQGGVAERPGGRGLGNLSSRARELGGRLTIDSGPDGTEVRLDVPPVAAASAASADPDATPRA